MHPTLCNCRLCSTCRIAAWNLAADRGAAAEALLDDTLADIARRGWQFLTPGPRVVTTP